uniref:Uncharacterized protein n=1 Tax=Geospiza parvula TaxID=87175 RepID=A0A8U8B657_GEOPR
SQPAPVLDGRLWDSVGTIKPARVGTGASLGLGGILRIGLVFQEPAGHSGLWPPNINNGPFLSETKVTSPVLDGRLWDSVGTIKPARVGTGASLGLGRHPASRGFSGASRPLRPMAPNINNGLWDSVGTIKPARVGTGASLGLGGILRIADFQEPARPSGLCPGLDGRLWDSVGTIKPARVGTGASLGLGGSQPGHSGLWPPNINNGPFPLKQKSPAPVLDGRLWDSVGTIKPARVGTGASLGLGGIPA